MGRRRALQRGWTSATPRTQRGTSPRATLTAAVVPVFSIDLLPRGDGASPRATVAVGVVAGPPSRSASRSAPSGTLGASGTTGVASILVAAMIEFDSFRPAHLIVPIAHGCVHRMK